MSFAGRRRSRRVPRAARRPRLMDWGPRMLHHCVRAIVFSLLTALPTAPAAAGADLQTRPAPRGHADARPASPLPSVDSGWIQTSRTLARDHAAAFSATVGDADAAWVRLRFAPGTVIPEGAVLVLIGEQDGAAQILDRDDLARWSHASAYFNGPSVRVELRLSPEHSTAEPARIIVRGLETPEPEAGVGRSICGPSDTREPTHDPRIGRYLPGGCTAFLIEPNGLLSAGHCVRPDGIVQFNVPPSGPDGQIRHPDPADQYPVDPASIQTPQPFMPGNDWAYFGLFPNPVTGLSVAEAQGPGFRLSPGAVAGDGRAVVVPSYGTASGAMPGELSRTLTVGAGPLAAVSGTLLTHQADTTAGSSGAPILDAQTGLVLGVHTSAGCDATTIPGQPAGNGATASWTPPLRAAIADPRGVNRDRDCDADGVNDFDQIAAGLGTDCNGNGILDACEGLDTLACGETSDPCDGRDCDGDGINDACAIAWGLVEDCNANGIPDSCDLLPTPVRLETPTVGPIDYHNPVRFTLNNLPIAETPVWFTVHAAADVDSQSETLTVLLNGIEVATLFRLSVDCDPMMATDGFELSASSFNALAAGGSLVIDIVPSRAVDDWRCGNQSRVRVDLRYDAPPFSRDTNGDGRPDECAPLACGPADIASDDGSLVPDGRVNVADLNRYVDLWLHAIGEGGELANPYADLSNVALSPAPDGRTDAFDLVYYVGIWLDSVGSCP